MKSFIFFLKVVFCILFSNQLNAQNNFRNIIHVPVDQPTIQLAINEAVNGDLVLVAPGEYFENINYNGKNITVAGNYINSQNISDIENTIINGSNSADLEAASCVTINSGENSSAILQGFTITQGTGSHWVDPQFPTYTWHSGGGVFIFQSSPTIKNNIIIDNHVDDDIGASGASGGGICMYGGNPLIVNNVIFNNTARYGAGVVIDYSGCIFKNNLVAANYGGQDYGGGAFWTIGNGVFPTLIENCTIVNNHSYSSGGAMYLWDSDITLINCIVWGNSQETGSIIKLTYGATVDITYTDIEGGYSGNGNIDVLPQFEDNLFILSDDSQCIDTGDPDIVYQDVEDPQNQGYALFPSKGELRNDMGMYGGPDCLDMESGLIAVSDVYHDDKSEMILFPNPFNDQLTIGIYSDRQLKAKLSLYHIKGIYILDKEIELQTGMNNETILTEGFASGFYNVKIELPNDVLSKIVIRK